MLCLKKKPKSDSQSLNGIIVVLHHEPLAPESEHYIQFASTGRTYTAESLCWHAAVKLHIKPITFHLFALYSLDRNFWLAPNDTIEVKEVPQRFEFRIRLKLSDKMVQALHLMDQAAFDYFYLQCRDDFLSDRFVGISNEEGDTKTWVKKCKGLMLIDVTCALLQAEIHPSQFNKHFKLKHFLAPVCVRKYTYWVQKKKLQRNLMKSVKQKYREYQRSSSDNNLNKLKIHFILGGIYEYFPQYLVEDFKTVQGDTLTVDPLRGSELCGVFLEDNLLVSIQDILEIHIRHERCNVIVQINKKEGIPEMVLMTSTEDARSFVSLLDKYYRMMEDYHVHVCNSVISPMIAWMDSAKCHGPVTGIWAVSKLEEFNKDREELFCNYLIKQVNRIVTDKPGRYWSLEVVRLNAKKQLYIQWQYNSLVDNMWDCQCSLSVEGAPSFSDLQELIRHYRTANDQVIQLQMCLTPSQSKPVQRRLLLCQRLSESQNGCIIKNMAIAQDGVPTILKDVTIVTRNIAEGKLTVIHKGTLPTHSSDEFVAVKHLKPEGINHLGTFTRSIHKVCFWSDINIVHIRGICMAEPLSIVQEYAAKGSISQYLCNPLEPVKVFQIVSAAKQLASALYYLYEEEEVHGSVCCKNVLIFHHTDRGMTVKLGDPGLVFHWNSKPLDHQANRDRLPWLAPELYTNLNGMSSSSDMFAFGITLWEMFSSGMRPYHNKPPEEIMQAARSGTFLEQPPQCPVQLFDLMKQCWNPDPAARLTARAALRNINSLEMNADGREYQEVLHVENRFTAAQINRSNQESNIHMVNGGVLHRDVRAMNDQVLGGRVIQARSLPLPPICSDLLLIQEYQLKMLNELGEGHFGQVYLADFTKGGITSQVAVKKLNKSNDMCVSEFEAEMKIMAKLDHPNIVSVIGKCTRRETETMQIVMEYVENGCLEKYLHTHKETIQQSDLIRFGVDVAAGMKYLSSCNILHNDLAARNVLVTNNRPFRAKISDFGLAKLLKPGDYCYKLGPEKGIPAFWCAPEALQYHKFSEKSDVWSFGVTLWEIYSLGKKPHMSLPHDPELLLVKLQKGDRLSTRMFKSPDGIPALMKDCWKNNKDERPYFKDIYETLCVIGATIL